MSIRKVTICLAVILFISATVLAFTSNKRAEKKAEKEYTPTVQTVTMTAVGFHQVTIDFDHVVVSIGPGVLLAVDRNDRIFRLDTI